jgi:hypothetical protein
MVAVHAARALVADANDPRPTSTRRAKWRCASCQRALTGRASNSSTATWTATATAGSRSAARSDPPTDGAAACNGSPMPLEQPELRLHGDLPTDDRATAYGALETVTERANAELRG